MKGSGCRNSTAHSETAFKARQGRGCVTNAESEYDRFIYLLGLMKSGPASDVIDLEDKALLNDIIEVWCNMIEPDQFAAVMSALRDCEDDRRRESIMDDMISFAYQRTPSSKESESEWRRKVERRLPNK
jgi:hypothetical protein